MYLSKSCNNCILFPVGNLNVELMKHSTYGGGVGSGRVRLFVGNRGSGRVGSTFRRVGSGRVQEKWLVDNFVVSILDRFASDVQICDNVDVKRWSMCKCVNQMCKCDSRCVNVTNDLRETSSRLQPSISCMLYIPVTIFNVWLLCYQNLRCERVFGVFRSVQGHLPTDSNPVMTHF